MSATNLSGHAIRSPEDIIPGQFVFVDQIDVPTNQLITSNEIQVQDVQAGANLSLTVSGGEYQINGGAWTSSPGIVVLGDLIKVRHFSSPSPSTAINTRLVINGIRDTFTTTTTANSGITYNGVSRLLPLDKNWAIVVIDTMPTLYTEINTLSGGELQTHVDNWIINGNDTARTARWDVRDQYIAQARKTHEVFLKETNTFSITSTNDSNYSVAQNPTQADYVHVSKGGILDEDEHGGVFKVTWYIYCYINFPTPLVSDGQYTIALTSGESVSFTFDTDTLISRSIKVNQEGYLPDAGLKRAYVGNYLYKFGPLDLSHTTTFEVINVATQGIAFSGPVTLIEANPTFGLGFGTNAGSENDPMYGEDVYECDFTAMTAEGDFYIRIPGVGRSWTFKHRPTAYSQAFYTAIRGMYQQRNGMAIDATYSNWPRQAAVTGPEYYESDLYSQPFHARIAAYGFPPPASNGSGFNVFNIVGGSIDWGTSTTQVPGGWHDAADWDCSLDHHTIHFDMLYAYEWNSTKFTDNQFGIPESGNGIPDLLSEVRHGLEVWRLSQDINGGISSRLETWTHANIDSELSGAGPPSPPNGKTDYAFGIRTRWASLIYATAAAQYSRLVAPFDATEAATYQQSALDAYAFGINSANALAPDYIINAAENRGQGAAYTYTVNEDDTWINPYWMHAKCQLYLLTDDITYITDAPSVETLDTTGGPGGAAITKPLAWRWRQQDFSPWIRYSIIEARDAGATTLNTIANGWEDFFTTGADLGGWPAVSADTLLSYRDNVNYTAAPYAATWQRTQNIFMGTGATQMSNYNRVLWIAYKLTGLAKYRDAAILNMDFVLGCNCMGMSWTTGLGKVYPRTFQHEISTRDGVDDPVPGQALYGLNGGKIYNAFRGELGSTNNGDVNAAWRAPPGNESSPHEGGVINSLTQTGGVATAITNLSHGLSVGDPIILDGSSSDWNQVSGTVATEDGDKTFTFAVDSGLSSPATGQVWFHYFVTDESQRGPPIWRKFMVHDTLNVQQCEFTIHECNTSQIFSMAMVFDESEALVKQSPKPMSEIHGEWHSI